MFDVCLRSTKLIESMICRALRRHWRHWSKIELTIRSTLFSCYFSHSVSVCMCLSASLRLSSAYIVANIFVSISTDNINFICTYTLNYMMLKFVVCTMIFLVFPLYIYIVYKFEQVLNMKLILTSSHERTYDT